MCIPVNLAYSDRIQTCVLATRENSGAGRLMDCLRIRPSLFHSGGFRKGSSCPREGLLLRSAFLNPIVSIRTRFRAEVDSNLPANRCQAKGAGHRVRDKTMDFSFTHEQTLLRDSVQKFIQNSYPFEERQKLVKTEEGFSRDNWLTFAELGWLALPFREEDGGIGGTPIELMILMEELGKGLVVEPYVPTIVLAGGMISAGANHAIRETILTEIMAGEKLAAFAFVEPQARFNLCDITTTAEACADGFAINGFKGVVIGGPSADYLVVPARTGGEQRDEQGITLFLVDNGAEGISRRDYPTVDGFRASEIEFENVRVSADRVIGDIGNGYGLIEDAVDSAILAIGAEAVGAMEVLYKTTVEYCKTREQFGQPIGKFQVLQHRMVDMFMEYEQSKSLLYMAAMRLDEGRSNEVRLDQEKSAECKKAVSALKVQIGKAGRFIGQNAIQLHGGMGMTDELNVGHYFKRLTMIDTMFGNVDFHLKRFGQL